MHKLERYLTENRLSQDDFAARVGVSQVAVSRWIAGTRMPRRETLARIASLTNGQVTANDFLGDAEEDDGEPAPCNGRAA